MTIDELDLALPAKRAAQLLVQDFPEVVFTSGRRGVLEQARAMASNVVRNRQWIVATYRDTPEARMLQAWIDAHPSRKTQEDIANGLMALMVDWDDRAKGRLSKHFSGMAFDVQPVDGPRGEKIKAAIRKLPGLTRFLEKEGGLVRWHAQFG